MGLPTSGSSQASALRDRRAVLSARIVRLRDEAERHQRRADMARAELVRAEAELRALDAAWSPPAHGR